MHCRKFLLSMCVGAVLACHAVAQIPSTSMVQPAYATLSTQTQLQPQAMPLPPTTPLDPSAVSYEELAQKIAALESKLVAQSSGVQQASFLSSSRSAQVDCGSFCSSAPKHSSNLYAGVDLTLFEPGYSASPITTNDDAVGVGPRLFIGFETSKNFGIRSRFWWLDMDSDALLESDGPNNTGPFVLLPFVLNIQASRFDVDFYRKFLSENGSFLFGTGITGAGLRFKFEEVLSMNEEGGGVSVFAEGKHRFYDSNVVSWSVASRGRWSYLLSDWELPLPAGVTTADIGFNEGDGALEIAEAELALEFMRKFSNWNFVARYGIEAQVWNATFLEKISFLGTTIRMGGVW